jgi:dihydrofolate synthase/folylpolyglutamate synthase
MHRFSPSAPIQADDDRTVRDRLAAHSRFGVHLGLDRIRTLLAALGNPQAQVPIIHVAGTNGKGSVCAYLSSVLTQAGYRVGRYTSPHLVSWCERITINGRPITAADLEQALDEVEAAMVQDRPQGAIAPAQETPTQFEIFTAAAWLYFAQQSVDIAVIEVGLGGRLDATNVCDRPLVSVITSLSREHWQRLGPTLADIAGEKAGVLKAGCPAVVGPLPPEAEAVVTARLQALNCPTQRPAPATAVAPGQAQIGDLVYPLPLPGQHQLVNSALAIAALHCLRQQGWSIPNSAIQTGMAAARWPGRLQWLTWRGEDGPGYPLLVDGAHNPAAAQVLRQYLDTVLAQPHLAPISLGLPDHEKNRPAVTWLMGMLSTKDHSDVFAALLRPGDRLHLVPVPDHLSASPEDLAAIAQQVCPNLATCHTHGDLIGGLQAIAEESDSLRVLCGSLYLIGHAFGTQRWGGGCEGVRVDG